MRIPRDSQLRNRDDGPPLSQGMPVPLVHARRHGSSREAEQGRPWLKFPDIVVWLIRFPGPVVSRG